MDQTEWLSYPWYSPAPPYPYPVDDREADRESGYLLSIRSEMLALWAYISPETYAAFEVIAADPEEQFVWGKRPLAPESHEPRMKLREINRELRKEARHKRDRIEKEEIEREARILENPKDYPKRVVKRAKRQRNLRKQFFSMYQESIAQDDDLFRQRLIEAVQYPALVELHPVDVVTGDHVGNEMFLEDFIGSRIFKHKETGDLMLGQRFKLPFGLASTMVPKEILNGNRQHNGQWAIAMALGEGSMKIVEEGSTLRLHRTVFS